MNTNYKLDSYLNQDVTSVKSKLENKGLEVIVVGDGDTIINQYPNKDIVTSKGNKVFLLTNGNKITIPDFKNWSRKDVYTYLYLADIKFTSNGTGYLVSQSIVDEVYTGEKVLEINFQEKYKEEPVVEEQKVEEENNT